MAWIRSASVGVRPVVGSVVTSPTEKIPNCIVRLRGPLSQAMRGGAPKGAACGPAVRLTGRQSTGVRLHLLVAAGRAGDIGARAATSAEPANDGNFERAAEALDPLHRAGQRSALAGHV